MEDHITDDTESNIYVFHETYGSRSLPLEITVIIARTLCSKI